MKVTTQKPLDPKEIGPGKSRQTDQRAKQSGEAAAKESSPVVSRTSLTATRVKEAIRNTPDIRADRVDAVKIKIQSGTYRVDADQLASKLIAESLREDIERDG
ncbi:MAG: flagellar biosynthesis anti-sigma factor FlgM [SAR324 cluster bacterium]|nr:flagellar biosynthesis anti-sigma factor FlgM [SAR324 cluster bacterium]